MKLISKKRYLQTFGICVIVLAIVRAAFPEVAGPPKHDTKKSAIDSLETVAVKEDTIVKEMEKRSEKIYMKEAKIKIF